MPTPRRPIRQAVPKRPAEEPIRQEPVRQGEAPIRPIEGRLFIDFLYIAFTITVTVIFGKFLATSTAEEIVEFFENEENWLSNGVVVACLVFIGLYSTNFFYYKRYEIMVDLALECLNIGRQKVLQFRGRFDWLRYLLAKLQPPPLICNYFHKAFKYLFLSTLIIFATLMFFLISTGRSVGFIAANIVVLLVYYLIAFSQDRSSFVWVAADLGYSFLYVGTFYLFYGKDEVAFLLINAGFASWILCGVWYFLNVPVKKEGKKLRKK